MSFRSYRCLIILFSLLWTLNALNPFSCSIDTDCHAFLMASCNQGAGLCMEPLTSPDCDSLGSGAGIAVPLTFSTTALNVCTRSCSSHDDCNGPTAKICKSARCIECLDTADCTTIGFKNHACTDGFCIKASVGCASSTYCANSCYDDGLRCWPECDNSNCIDANCMVGVASDLCSFPSNSPSSLNCNTNGDCKAQLPVCDSVISLCVECSVHSDCSRFSLTHICIDGECVSKSCTTDTDCNVSPPAYCENSYCRPCRTSDNAGCDSALASKCVSDSQYSCTGCTGDSDCAHLSMSYCNSGKCGICKSSSHEGCTSLTHSRCFLSGSTYSCISCQVAFDCQRFTSTPTCSSGTCVASSCSIDTNCASTPSTPYCEGNACRPCKTSDHTGCSTVTASKCVSSPSYSCVACTDNSDCTHLGSTPYCNGGTCGACQMSDNSGCSLATAPKCSNSGSIFTCTGCSGDEDCEHLSADSVCDTNTNTCISTCTGDGDCSSSTEFCNEGVCAICKTLNNEGCDTVTASKCSNSGSLYSCIACSNDGDCGHLSLTPYCNSGTCGACKTSDDSGCSSATASKCFDTGSAYICTTCSVDSDCNHLSSIPYCNSGTCGECKTSDNSGCSSATASKCIDPLSIAQCTGCSTNSDCSHLSSTPYCNSGICGFCSTSTNAGCNSVSASKCSASSGSTFSCTTCSLDSDCSNLSSTPYCNGGTCGLCRISDNTGCGTPTASKCVDTGSAYECTTCSSDTDCNHLSQTIYCNSGTCGKCKTSDNNGCSSETASKCTSPGSGNPCTACSVDSDCSHISSTPYCNSGTCGACKTSDNSGCLSEIASKCTNSGSFYSCSACSVDADCNHLSTTPYCNSGTCGSCKASNNNGCLTVALSKCTNSGPNYFCTTCSVDSDCNHLSSTIYCNSGTCGLCSTSTNAGCNSVSTPKCSASYGSTFACTTCSVDSDCTNFLSTTFCEGSSCVTCKTSDNSGCNPSSSQPKCLSMNSGNNVCVQCINNQDCSSSSVGKFCHSNHICVECITTADCNDPSKICNLDSFTCISQAIPTATLSFVEDSKRDLILTISEDLSVLPPECQFFYLQIENLTWPRDFNYTWSIENSHTVSITLTYDGQVEIHKNLLKVLFNASAIPPSTNFSTPQQVLSLALSDFVPLSAAALAATNGIKTTSQVIGSTAVVATLPTLFTSGAVGSLWNFVGICQIVNYLLYLLVTWPENAQTAFDLFSAAELTFIPNPFGGIIESITELGNEVSVPDVFAKNGVKGLFIDNAGSTVLIWTLVLIFYLLSKVLHYFRRNYKGGKLTQIINYFHSNMEWRAVLRAMSSSYLSLGLAVALQLYSTSFGNWAASLSAVLAVIFGYGLFFYFVISWWILYNRPKRRSRTFMQKYGPLFEEFKTDTLLQRYFTIFILARRATYIGFLVGFSDSALVQVPLVAVNSFVAFLALVLIRPYKEKKELILNIISEGVISALMVCALVLLHDQTATTPWMSSSDKIIVGWVVIALCAVLLLANVGFMLYDTILTYRQWYQKIKLRCQKKNQQPEQIPKTKFSIHSSNDQLMDQSISFYKNDEIGSFGRTRKLIQMPGIERLDPSSTNTSVIKLPFAQVPTPEKPSRDGDVQIEEIADSPSNIALFLQSQKSGVIEPNFTERKDSTHIVRKKRREVRHKIF